MRTTGSFVANKQLFIEDNIDNVNSDKEIVEVNVVGNKFGMRLFTLKTRLIFDKLMKTFSIAQILHHLNPECHIWIKTDISDFTNSGIFSKLTLDRLGQ